MKLDLSINQLRSMATLSTLHASELKEVYITSNKVSTIEVWLVVVTLTGKIRLVSMDVFAYVLTVQNVLKMGLKMHCPHRACIR